MTTWLNLLLVAVGGAVGSVLRYLLMLAAISIPGGSTPWGTLAANLIGCAGIAAVMEYGLVEGGISPRLSLAVRVGLLGGLTTFSTFAAESMTLLGTGRGFSAAVYMIANIVGGLAIFWGMSSLVRGWIT